MKVRTGFVSNSSSCSFKLDLNGISSSMLDEIEKATEDTDTCWETWTWDKATNVLEGFTIMDNFGMSECLDRINFPKDHILEIESN